MTDVEAVTRAGLPAITPDYPVTTFIDDRWAATERAARTLTGHVASARFADEATYGILLVPDPAPLDSRRPMTPAIVVG